MRDKYKETFGEMVPDDDHANLKGKKLFKIKYTLNILPFIGEHMGPDGNLQKSDVNLMQIF